MFNTVNYTLQVPQEGGRIDFLPRFEDEVRSTGRIAAVVDEGLVDDLENFTVKIETGQALRIVVLRPESRMDDEAIRCFTLLDWHRAGSGSFENETEPAPSVRRGILQRVAAGIWDQVQDRPLIVLGLVVIATGIVLVLLGHTKLGEAFIDLGMKVFLTLGALVHSVIASAPAILNDVSDWVEPIYFMTRFVA